jgi:hypothetical protein
MEQVLRGLVDKAMEERKAIGLYIPTIDVRIGVFQTEKFAMGYPIKGGKNLLVLNLSHYREEEEEKALQLQLIRCEVERLAILEAKINEELLRINEEEKKLEEAFSITRREKEKERELARVKMKKINNFLYIEPINESSFLVFFFVPYNGWESLRNNPEGVKNRIIESFPANLVRYTERITEALLINAYSEGKINDKTCQYVWNSLYLYYGERNRSREGEEGEAEEYEGVDVQFGKNIMEEVLKYEMKVKENANRAAEAIVRAYTENPSRLNKAYKYATDYDEFLAYLVGD